jgi:ATP-dependent Clp protease protease subunit
MTEDLANNMIALTLHLDSLDNKRIYYWLNLPGGEVGVGLRLHPFLARETGSSAAAAAL